MSERFRTQARIASFAVLACAVIAGVWGWSRNRPPFHSGPAGIEVLRQDLVLRGGLLIARGESEPFNGTLTEDFAAGRRKLEIEIRDGKAHGLSRGWYESGQLEVEETFVRGVSHGWRTRWHANGARKSLAQIEDGEIVGMFLEWHDNGRKAVQMMMEEGRPHGLAEAWHPSGALRSRVRFDQGRQVSQEFWDDPSAVSSAQ